MGKKIQVALGKTPADVQESVNLFLSQNNVNVISVDIKPSYTERNEQLEEYFIATIVYEE